MTDSVAVLLRSQGLCGALGHPRYEDGLRWRTWCLEPTGHQGPHQGRGAGAPTWELPAPPPHKIPKGV